MAPNPPYGALITYYLKEKLGEEDKASIDILDSDDNVIRTLKAAKKKGYNRINWDLRHKSPVPESTGRSAVSGPLALPGSYTAKLNIKESSQTTALRVYMDPRIKASTNELTAQRDTLLELGEIYAKGFGTNKKIQALQQQSKEVEEMLSKLEDPDKAVKDQLKAFDEKLKEINTKLNGAGGRRSPSVMRNLSGLMRNIQGYSAAPTAQQKRKIKQSSTKIDEISKELEAFIESDMKKLNRDLNNLNIPFFNPEKKSK